MERIIEINGTVFSRHVGKDVTEEEFFEAFEAFLDEHDWLFGGVITECDADED